jgi:hypothetical protein
MAKRTATKTLKARAERITADLAEADGAQDMCIVLASYIIALQERVAELEANPLDYRGTWTEGETYPARTFISHGGSVWWTGVETKARPGEGVDWKLAVKRGQQGASAKP